METLTLESLKHLDGGRALQMFDLLLRRAGQDCYDRPADRSARKVPMTAILKPVMGQDGRCDGVTLEIEFNPSTPKFRTATFPMLLKPNGAIVFNPDSPDNPRQLTMTDDEADA